MKLTLVVEMPDDYPHPIEQMCAAVLRDDKPGQLVYAYKADAVADLRHILANSGTAEGLDAAIARVQVRWWS